MVGWDRCEVYVGFEQDGVGVKLGEYTVSSVLSLLRSYHLRMPILFYTLVLHLLTCEA